MKGKQIYIIPNLDEEIETLEKKLDSVNEKISNLYKLSTEIRTELESKKDIKRQKDINNLKSEHEIEFYLDVDKSDYKSTMKYFSDKPLTCKGSYNSNSNQYILNIAIEFDNQIKSTAEYIDTVLPYIKGKVYFSLSENTLAEFGVYSVSTENNKFVLNKTTYGCTKTLHTFDNSLELIEYIAMYHKYG